MFCELMGKTKMSARNYCTRGSRAVTRRAGARERPAGAGTGLGASTAFLRADLRPVFGDGLFPSSGGLRGRRGDGGRGSRAGLRTYCALGRRAVAGLVSTDAGASDLGVNSLSQNAAALASLWFTSLTCD